MGIAIEISPPRTDPSGLDELAALWKQLHSHHREVADYQPLIDDLDASWARRGVLYRRLLSQGAVYFTAADEDGRIVGYAMVAVEQGLDDTFETDGGIAEVVTLVVDAAHRSAGTGHSLLAAAEDFARGRGIDTVKIAVMSGNARAQRFYEANGYACGEHVLYRRLPNR